MDIDPGIQLAVALTVMFFGALVAGGLPYFVRVKESSLKTVAALGGGLLVGTSLAVVIPEGFHALSGGEAQSHDHADHDSIESEHGGGQQYAGLALVGGFLGMLVLDHIQHAIGATHLHSDAHPQQQGGGCSHGSHGHTHSPGLAAAPSEETELIFDSADIEQQTIASSTTHKGSSPQRAVTGLLVHCAADGLAMGAAALSGDLGLSLMISIAMVVHKAPMAFGLATYLMNHKWSWARAQPTMIMFAAMAPVGATTTYLLLGNLPFFTSPVAIALIVLFSGGTFLYAATMHILPDVLGAGCHLTFNQIAALCAGGVMPAILAFGHEH